ncbi:MAG: SDR family NAD(P)-dependent oxidoreductase [candidate division WOR-3 bacterium]
MLLQGKTAIVTGGIGALGRAIVECLTDEGARVAVCDLNPSAVKAQAVKLRKAGREIMEAPCDVTQPEECESTLQKVVGRFGKLDILVNSAGVRSDVPLAELSRSDWDRVLETNLSGLFNTVKAAQPHMISQGYGKIVNIASDLSTLFDVGQSHQIAAGYGVQGLTKALAVELGPYNITVNCVIPDFIETEMTRKAARAHGMYMDDFRKAALAMVPLRRLGTPQDVANLCLFLVTDNAGFISGQIIHVRGGP